METTHLMPVDAFVETVNFITNHSVEVAPRGMRTREIANLQLIVLEPWHTPFDVDGRNLNHTITALEFCQLLGQTSMETAIRERVRAVAKYHDYGIGYGNYGTRAHGQIANVIRELVHDKNSRRAVISLYYGPADLRQETKDIPCTLTLQFLIRHDKLLLRVNMRSNDAWLGLPYDLMQFTMLQCALAQVLGIDVGYYCHSVGSMHMYERDLVHDRLGECISMDLSAGEMLLMVKDDPLERLEEAVITCQDVVYGDEGICPETAFEEWLAAQAVGA